MPNSIDEKVCRTLELSSAAAGSNNAAAVFADENRFPGVDIVRFGDTINELMDRQTTEHVSALKLYDDAMVMFNRYYRYEEIDGAQRRTRYLVPENAYREAIANALVHRDWTVQAMVKVACFGDRIEISSPGGLPNDVSEEDYLGGHLSVLRNPIIGGVFARLGYIERFGTGIPRIRAAYDGCARKPRFVITANSITVCLPVISEAAELNAQERAIVDLLRDEGSLSRPQIEKALQLSRMSVLRILKKLAEDGVITVEGRARGTKYRV